MKTSPSKSSRSSRTSPYHVGVQGQAATGAGGVANDNVENAAVNGIQLPNSGTAGSSPGQRGQVIVTNERKIELNGGDLLITRSLTGQTVVLLGDGQQEHQASVGGQGLQGHGARDPVMDFRVVKRVLIQDGVVQGQQQQGPGGQVIQGQQQQGPGGQVIQGQQQQGPGGQVIQGQQQQGPGGQVVQQQEEMPPPVPVAPQVEEGQKSSSCCVFRKEVESLQGSVDQLSQKLDIQGRKIMRFRDSLRNAAITLREVGQEQEGLGERQGQRVNGDEEVDVGYDSEINTGEGIDGDGGQGGDAEQG